MNKLYVITRRDLPPGQRTAQSVHAACNYAFSFDQLFKLWQMESNVVVILSAFDENHLNHLLGLLRKKSELAIATVNEPDRNNELTSIAFVNSAESADMISELNGLPTLS